MHVESDFLDKICIDGIITDLVEKSVVKHFHKTNDKIVFLIYPFVIHTNGGGFDLLRFLFSLSFVLRGGPLRAWGPRPGPLGPIHKDGPVRVSLSRQPIWDRFGSFVSSACVAVFASSPVTVVAIGRHRASGPWRSFMFFPLRHRFSPSSYRPDRCSRTARNGPYRCSRQ